MQVEEEKKGKKFEVEVMLVKIEEVFVSDRKIQCTILIGT
jgi:hypothetical protein